MTQLELDSRILNPETAATGQPTSGDTQESGITHAEATFRFADNSLENVGEARRAVADYLRFVATCVTPGITPDIINSSVLCASEVVTDAATHGGEVGLTHVRIVAGLGGFAILVGSGAAKNGSVPKANHNVAPDAETGRGLEIVEALSNQWGYTTMDPETTGDQTATETWFAMETAATLPVA